MVEIKNKSVYIFLAVILVIGLITMLFQIIYLQGEDYASGNEVLLVAFTFFLVLELMVVRPIEYAIKLYRKERKGLKSF